MQIKVNLQIFLFIIIFALTHQIQIYGFIMLFAFIHELGHMLAGLFLKLRPKELSFMPFGISISFETYGYKRLLEIKKMLIAIAGPLTNIIILIITMISKIDTQLKQLIVYSNILIVMFNLIPIYPLDGGRILKSLLHIEFGSQEAKKIINIISNIVIIMLTIVASITVYYFKNIAIFLICIFLWIITIQENRKFKNETKIYEMIKNS